MPVFHEQLFYAEAPMQAQCSEQCAPQASLKQPQLQVPVHLTINMCLQAYPFMHAGQEGSKFLLQLLYLLDRTPYYSPALWLLGQRVVRVTGSELVRSQSQRFWAGWTTGVAAVTRDCARLSPQLRCCIMGLLSASAGGVLPCWAAAHISSISAYCSCTGRSAEALCSCTGRSAEAVISLWHLEQADVARQQARQREGQLQRARSASTLLGRLIRQANLKPPFSPG